MSTPLSFPEHTATFVDWLDSEGRDAFSPIAGELAAQLTPLNRAGAEARLALHDSIMSHLSTMPEFIGSAEQGATLQLPPAADAYARLLAHHRIPLAILMHSYEIGQTIVWRRFAASLRQGPLRLSSERRADVLEASSLHLLDYINAVTSLSIQTYEEVRHSSAGGGPAVPRAEVVRRFLDGTCPPEAAEDALSYRLGSTHVGYVAWTHRRDQAPALRERVNRAVSGLGRQHICVPAGEGVVHGWFSAGDKARRQLASVPLPADVTVAVGSPAPGGEGFRSSHQEALEARRFAENAGLSGVVLFEDVAVAILASKDQNLAESLVERYLGRLGRSGDTRLLDTLRIYLRELASPSRTARRLRVHPNTVAQRLRRIETLLEGPVDPTSLNLRVALEVEPLLRARSHAAE